MLWMVLCFQTHQPVAGFELTGSYGFHRGQIIGIGNGYHNRSGVACSSDLFQIHSQQKITFFNSLTFFYVSFEAIAFHCDGIDTYMNEQFHAICLNAKSM